MKVLRNIYSDWRKTKNTPIRIILAVVPILYTSLVLWYSSTSSIRGTAGYQEWIYFSFFELMGISFPLAEGLVCGLVGLLEKNAGGFYNTLSTDSRIRSYLSKFLMIVLMNIFVVFSSVFILLFGMKFILHVEKIRYLLFFQGASMAIVGCLFLILIHLTLSFRFGIGASMAAGGAGFLVSAMIGASNIGDKVWQFVPWTWTIRLPQLIELQMANIGMKNGMPLAEYARVQFFHNLPIVLLGTVLILLLNSLWFKNWEGAKSHE